MDLEWNFKEKESWSWWVHLHEFNWDRGVFSSPSFCIWFGGVYVQWELVRVFWVFGCQSDPVSQLPASCCHWNGHAATLPARECRCGSPAHSWSRHFHSLNPGCHRKWCVVHDATAWHSECSPQGLCFSEESTGSCQGAGCSLCLTQCRVHAGGPSCSKASAF